ncbi:MAG: hypothetical protein ABI175_17840 [Polyangiales bacterium]
MIIARGSALECAAVLDAMQVVGRCASSRCSRR